ncbi:MAG TPA: hypothetical protein VFA33_18675 [Bryobacteraceae bacterium]|nr:hypothetical protein [Bryobacteraceae bacterium]
MHSPSQPLWLGCALFAAGILAAQSSIFRVQPSPSSYPRGVTLNAVAAFAANDVWAVGYRGSNFPTNQTKTLIEHFDGANWSVAPSPNPAHGTQNCPADETANVLNAVGGTSSSDVWAVGYFFHCATLINLEPLILHWDGMQWKVAQAAILSTHGNNALNGVIALSPTNAYAVGYQAASNGAVLTLVEHWDGTQWSVMPSPNANPNGNQLNAVSAASPTDIWAVGSQVDQITNTNQTLVEHFDGVQWTVMPSPNPLHGDLDQNILNGVVAVSPTDVTAVGFLLNTSIPNALTLVEHWDGAKWRVVPSPNVSTAANDANHLNAVAAFSASDIYAVGWFEDAATVGQHHTLIERFDGSAWRIIASPTAGAAQHLNGVFALAGTRNAWVAGAFSIHGTDPEFGDLIIPRTLILFTPIG